MSTDLRISLTFLLQSEEQKSEDDWVRLTSTDGFSVIVKRKLATASGTLKSMLSAESKPYSMLILYGPKILFCIGSFAEALSNTCPINERFELPFNPPSES